MLTFDPSKRITVDEALKHEYLSALHCPEDEPTTELVSAFDFDFEIYDLKHSDYRDLLYEEVLLYHDDQSLAQYLENKKQHPNGILSHRFPLNKVKSKRESKEDQQDIGLS